MGYFTSLGGKVRPFSYDEIKDGLFHFCGGKRVGPYSYDAVKDRPFHFCRERSWERTTMMRKRTDQFTSVGEGRTVQLW